MSDNIDNQIPPSGGKGAHVCLTPALLPLYNVEEYIVVVIDIFRATSSICYGIENGAEAIIPVSQVEECSAYREKGLDYLLAAERDGKVVERGTSEQVFGAPQTPYTKALIAAAFDLEAVA